MEALGVGWGFTPKAAAQKYLPQKYFHMPQELLSECFGSYVADSMILQDAGWCRQGRTTRRSSLSRSP